MYNGIINVYKEAGFTSHDVVAKLRGICKQKKIGHTGTLDPDAVGVLPVCFGSGTKLCDMLTDWNKEYIAVLQLGVVTDTQDLSGTVVNRATASELEQLDEAAITDAVLSFQGEYAQVPPMYSALKVNGRKLYELAREGKEVERQARTVFIEEIEIQNIEYLADGTGSTENDNERGLPLVTMRVVCSKGTYIRTLCHDIGQKLCCGGAMRSLTRSRVGIFAIEDSLSLNDIEKLRDEDRLSEVMIKPDAIFGDARRMHVNEAGRKMVQNGNCLVNRQLVETCRLTDGEQVRIYDAQEQFYGIYGYHAKERLLKPVKMFLDSTVK